MDKFSKATLEQLQAHILAGDSVTGSVAVSAVSAALATTVLHMALEIVARKRPGDQVRNLIESADAASARLLTFADDDRAAYAAYLQARRMPAGEERREALRSALRHAIETPLAAARAAASAISLCGDAARLARGAIAADISGTAVLLSGAVRAILFSVEVNRRTLDDPAFSEAVAAESRTLEQLAARETERVVELARAAG
jgi:formiminotetrahydrofolate cyclodeaminase